MSVAVVVGIVSPFSERLVRHSKCLEHVINLQFNFADNESTRELDDSTSAYRIDTKAVGSSLHPIDENVLHGLHNRSVAVVQVGLAGCELMEIILLSLLIPSPGSRGKHCLLKSH